MAKAVIYARCSTDEQAESGLGLEAQEQTSRQYAARVGIEVSHVFRDPGLSGSLGLLDRPGLMAAIEALEGGDILLVSKRDRIGRLDPFEMGLIEHEVKKRKARIASAAGEGTESDTPENLLLRGVIDLLARHERLQIGMRTKAALAAKKARGEKVGRAPYGWNWSDGRLVENAVEQHWVGNVMAMHEQGLSFGKIASRLTGLGVTKRSGGQKWHDMEVRRIVRRESRMAAV